MASRIHVLPEGCINQIAAGEVIERPYSVVKELLENAIDAQASRIDVAVEAGGVPLIRVRDNGLGMTEEEIAQAVLPHATSKIGAFEDLISLDTLGFRGEALPSMASVAEMEIVSRPRESVAGSFCRWEAGVCVDQGTCGCPPGTTVTVRNLFANVPARLKFLKSAGTEFGLISEMMGRLAMSRPDIGFSLAHPQRVILQTPGNGDLRDVLGQVLGKELAQTLVSVGGMYEGLSVGGFISPPHVVRSSKNTQTFIVNGRVVRAKVLAQALREAYHTHVPAGRHPVVVLVLKLDPSLLDVNVHPAKTEVKFQQERQILERLRESLGQALRVSHSSRFAPGLFAVPQKDTPKDVSKDVSKDASLSDGTTQNYVAETPQEYQVNPGEDADTSMDSGKNEAAVKVSEEVCQKTFAEKVLPKNMSADLVQDIRKILNKDSLRVHFGEGVSIAQFFTEEEAMEEDGEIWETGEAEGEGSEKPAHADEAVDGDRLLPRELFPSELSVPVNENEAFFQSLRPLAQLFKTYILAAGGDVYYVIDQHAAHERIRYEEFLAQALQSEVASQLLLTPLALHLTLREEQAMLEYLPQLRQMGFLVEEFGTRTYLLRGVPVGSGQMDAEEYFHRFLDAVLTTAAVPSLPDLMEKWIFVLACRNSIKGSDTLSLAEMGELLHRLGQVRNPYSCPHGRPVLIPLTRQELEKRFGRT
ncbi:MAG: DNA mismatch repair endonuclease MutL [Peptococcaceae bacterium]|nr:DNA mismatch repair endonuclease MutL [Peptococcaceae bacterium]